MSDYKISLAKPSSDPSIEQVHKVEKLADGKVYYVTKFNAELTKKLCSIGLIPFSCTCEDFTMRRIYRPGQQCKHIAKVISLE
jgi:hypothetical protein